MTTDTPDSIAGLIEGFVDSSPFFSLLLRTDALLTLVVGVLFVVLLHRHNLISYGSERETGLAELFFVVSLFCYPYREGTSIVLVGLFTIILVLSSSLVLHSYALERSPFIAFYSGLGIGLLSVLHPVYLAFAPYLLYRFSRLRLLSPKHFSAFIMAIVAAWGFVVPIFAVPTVEGLVTFIKERLLLISDISLPSGRVLIYLVGALVLVCSVGIKVYDISPRSIARHKWMMNYQVGISILALILAVLYSGEAPLVLSLLFFQSSTLRHLISEPGRRERAVGWFFYVALLIVLSLFIWSYLGGGETLFSRIT